MDDDNREVHWYSWIYAGEAAASDQIESFRRNLTSGAQVPGYEMYQRVIGGQTALLWRLPLPEHDLRPTWTLVMREVDLTGWHPVLADG